MEKRTRAFQIFVKPAGPSCNLQCSYCYYLDKKQFYHDVPSFRMTDEILETYIIRHIEATTDDTVFFSWHGGEPLLAGLDFFRKAVVLQQKHLSPGRMLLNGIQTNGTLLNEDWCRFLTGEKFIVGISIDGPEALHNHHRQKSNGNGSFSQVLKGYRLLRQYGIPTEILCVVNSENVHYPLEIYHFFKQLDAGFITFLPLVQREPHSTSGVTPASVPAEAFGHFLSYIFDEWVEKDIGRIKVQIFEEAIRSAFDKEHTLCIFKENCGGVPVVEHNGDVYSCDHFVNPDHYLGNIRNHSLAWYLDSPEQQAFGEAKSKTLPEYCLKCPVITMCNGECPKNRFILTPDGEAGLNYLCLGYQLFFNHCQPFIEAVRIMSDHP